MRLFFGMILGAALTIAVAYVSDTATKSPGADTKPMVNWEVVGQNVSALTAAIKSGWAKLTVKD